MVCSSVFLPKISGKFCSVWSAAVQTRSVRKSTTAVRSCIFWPTNWETSFMPLPTDADSPAMFWLDNSETDFMFCSTTASISSIFWSAMSEISRILRSTVPETSPIFRSTVPETFSRDWAITAFPCLEASSNASTWLETLSSKALISPPMLPSMALIWASTLATMASICCCTPRTSRSASFCWSSNACWSCLACSSRSSSTPWSSSTLFSFVTKIVCSCLAFSRNSSICFNKKSSCCILLKTFSRSASGSFAFICLGSLSIIFPIFSSHICNSYACKPNGLQPYYGPSKRNGKPLETACVPSPSGGLFLLL